MPNVPEDSEYLTQAIADVTGMLTKKKDVWTNGMPIFENFDLSEEFGGNPVQFALQMCRLKMNRLKSVFWKHQFRSDTPHGFIEDPDGEDSLVDLASYAILGLALVRRRKAQLEKMRQEIEKSTCNGDSGPEAELVKIWMDKYMQTPEGKAEIAKLAREIMEQDDRENNPWKFQDAK